MGLVSSLAKKVVGKVLGKQSPAAAAPRATATPAARSSAPDEPVAEAEGLARIECGAQELKERLDAGEFVVTVDVREPAELLGGMLPDARHIPLGQLESRWEELKDANEIVCYCAAGGRSLRAAQLLRSKGLFNATSLEGGFGAWRAIGGAVTTPAKG